MTRTRMRPFAGTIPLEQARALIDDGIRPIERTERVPLDAANGRVLSTDIVSTSDVPPFARAAMDGYAVRAGDTTGATREQPKTLACIEKVFTGQMPARPVATGQCTEIATGAPMPQGADAVVMVEDTVLEDAALEDAALQDTSRVRIFAAVVPRQNVGRQGGDIEHGQTVLHAGDVLNPSRVGALAALGLADVSVYARPRVAILSTGNEIVEPGTPLTPGHIYDVNRFTLSAVIGAHGGVPVPHRTAADTVEDLSRALDDCTADDVLVFSGGSSVGERDLIMDVLAERGQILFHGIAVKPGKPTAFGLVNGRPFFGMPGYPTSCLSNAHILLVPALRRIARLSPHAVRTTSVPLGQRILSPAGRHQFYTVRIVEGIARPAFKASGDITSMAHADGYIEIPTHVEVVEKDTMVEVTLF